MTGFDIDDEITVKPINEDDMTWLNYLQGGMNPEEREKWEKAGLLRLVTGKDNPQIGKIHEAFARLGEINSWEPNTEPPYRLVMTPIYQGQRNSESDPWRSVFNHTKVILEPQWGGINRGGLKAARDQMGDLIKSVSS